MMSGTGNGSDPAFNNGNGDGAPMVTQSPDSSMPVIAPMTIDDEAPVEYLDNPHAATLGTPLDSGMSGNNNNNNNITNNADATTGVFSPQEIAAQNMASARHLDDGAMSVAGPGDTSGMQEINIDPLPRENMILEGAEEGGVVDVKRRNCMIATTVGLFMLCLAIVLAISIPLAVRNRGPTSWSGSQGLTTSSGPMTGDELLLDETLLEEDQENNEFGAEDNEQDDEDQDTTESEAQDVLEALRREEIMARLKQVSPTTVETAGTPQNDAANFIINDDELKMEPSSTRLIQRYVLTVLYKALDGESWTNKTKVLEGVTECQWHGIVCGDSGNVLHISWGNNSLSGVIPSEIGELVHVNKLRMNDNSISGKIPKSIWKNMTNLFTLDLGNNLIEGQLLDEDVINQAGRLRELNLYTNLLYGKLPETLGNLTSLRTLKLYDNGFTGTIPTRLGQLSQIKRLDLDDNFLDGDIPTELGSLDNLEVLWMNGNSKLGASGFPSQLTQLTKLQKLYLGDMSITGPLPDNIGDLSNLIYLQLKNNQMNGPLPSSLGSLSKLEAFEADRNAFTGALPTTLGQLESLRILYISGNNFGSSIPSEWGGMTNLTTFVASQANITSKFPSELGLLTNVQYLLLDRNNMGNSLPKEIGNMTSLSHLYLYDNKFTGVLPSSLGQLTNLKELVIDQNDFEGELPEELSGLTNLVTMFVFENNFNGTVPDPVCSLKRDSGVTTSTGQPQGSLKNLWADCMDKFDCTCCTACCVFNSAYNGCYYVN